ncbi:hypothetical protein AB669_18270 [Pedobacter sp. BMA]|nr:hypothetical protein AB669_18270 [Pedobacter sp. BMA]
MKQAILIVAYKDIDYLKKLITFFNPNDYIFFIHLNKKSVFTGNELKTLTDMENVKIVVQKYNTHWGSFNHLKAILHLCSVALDFDISYLHLISGQDFPAMSGEKIKDFLRENKGKEFLEHFEFPADVWKDEGYGLDRINFFHLNDFVSSTKRSGRYILRLVFTLQKILHLRRSGWGGLKLFGGGTWWTLSKECIAYVLRYIDENPAFYERFNYTKIPEEILFQTVIMNSHFKSNVVNNNLRYIDWNWKNGSRPAILDENDFQVIKNSNALFARKFILPISAKLLDILTEDFKKA